MTTGEQLALYMRKHGISKRYLSSKTGIYINTITRIMRGDKVGNIHTWLALAEAMGCTLDDILNETDERF